MTVAFNALISRLTSLIVVDLYEVLSVSCDAQVDTFETVVEVDFEFESEDGTISQAATATFIETFLQSYNSLQARYCDPLFREAEAADVVDQQVTRSRRDRSLQVRATSKYKITFRLSVVGKCRGCPPKSTLFLVRYFSASDCVTAASFAKFCYLLQNDAVKRRLQVPERRIFPEGEIYSKYRRVQSDEGQCFCAVANIASSAPTEREFLVGYNNDISGLAEQLKADYVLTQVHEEANGTNVDDAYRQDCTADADCVDSEKGDFCVNFSCIHAGNPRITLTWEGDDDLDLVVYTPDGVRIGYDATYDETSGGSFDTLFSQEVFAPHAESIFFPMWGGPHGTYVIQVYVWEQRDLPDDWTVEIFTAESGTEPIIIKQGTGNRDDILFDFGETGLSLSADCSMNNAQTECCTDDQCGGVAQRCANKQCVTAGVRTFTLSWTGSKF